MMDAEKKIKRFLRLLFGVGLVLTEPRQRHRIYNRMTDKLDDVADQASRGYDAVADRVERAYRSARGEDHRLLGRVVTFAVGAGVGAGAALLLAPASGRDTRAAIADKVHDIQSNARERFRSEAKTA